MKRYILLVVILILGSSPLIAESQSQRLRQLYDSRGDALLHALFSLPETSEAVRSRVPETEKWIPFQESQWKELPEAEKISLIGALGKEWEFLEPDELNLRWERVWTWLDVASELDMVAGCAESMELFFEVVYHDPLTKPAFDAVIKSRPENFAIKHIGETLATGEMIAMRSDLILRVMAASQAARYRLYSRLLAQLAARIEINN